MRIATTLWRPSYWTAALLLGTALAVPPLPSARAEAVRLGPNPSECEIQAALLGSSGAGCPPVLLKRPPPPLPSPEPATAIVTLPTPVQKPAQPAPEVVTQTDRTTTTGTTSAAVALSAAFRIGFDFNSARIRPESRAVLDRVGAVMAGPEAGNTRFRVVGHTDAVGSDAANLALSQRRAKAVVDYLVEHHRIPNDRLDAAGLGARELLVPADPRAAENRRVEIINLGG
ncbi:OmpA family protein [Azospirillum sp. sgz302134]